MTDLAPAHHSKITEKKILPNKYTYTVSKKTNTREGGTENESFDQQRRPFKLSILRNQTYLTEKFTGKF
jgi:hypothetical protein